MSDKNRHDQEHRHFPPDIPLIHGPVSPKEQARIDLKRRNQAKEEADYAFQERQVDAIEASNSLARKSMYLALWAVIIAAGACGAAWYQGFMNKKSWETAQETLEQMRADAGDSSRQFQVQLGHFDDGLGRTGLLAAHAGEQASAAKRAADAAISAANTAKDALTTSQGAYVTIGRKDGAVAEFVTSKDHSDENVPLVVYFQNTGHIPARVAWDTSDRKDGVLESLGIRRFSNGTGRSPLSPAMLDTTGKFSQAVGMVIAGDSVGRSELAYISQSDLQKLSTKIVGFYIDGFYAYCDQLGSWSTHQFTLNYHTDAPTALRFELISDTEIANVPIPKSTGTKSFYRPCTPTVAMYGESQQKH